MTDTPLEFAVLAEWRVDEVAYVVLAVRLLGQPCGVGIQAFGPGERQREAMLPAHREAELAIDWAAADDEERTRVAETALESGP